MFSTPFYPAPSPNHFDNGFYPPPPPHCFGPYGLPHHGPPPHAFRFGFSRGAPGFGIPQHPLHAHGFGMHHPPIPPLHFSHPPPPPQFLRSEFHPMMSPAHSSFHCMADVHSPFPSPPPLAFQGVCAERHVLDELAPPHLASMDVDGPQDGQNNQPDTLPSLDSSHRHGRRHHGGHQRGREGHRHSHFENSRNNEMHSPFLPAWNTDEEDAPRSMRGPSPSHSHRGSLAPSHTHGPHHYGHHMRCPSPPPPHGPAEEAARVSPPHRHRGPGQSHEDETLSSSPPLPPSECRCGLPPHFFRQGPFADYPPFGHFNVYFGSGPFQHRPPPSHGPWFFEQPPYASHSLALNGSPPCAHHQHGCALPYHFCARRHRRGRGRSYLFGGRRNRSTGCECPKDGDSESEPEVDESDEEEAEDVIERAPNDSLNAAHANGNNGWVRVEEDGRELDVLDKERDEAGRQSSRDAKEKMD